MAHLSSFRKGWENERLASFLLSRFSFVAQPLSVADDLGIDYLCTTFERKYASVVARQTSLDPGATFGIQIKSNAKCIELKAKSESKIRYLCGLDVPFFVGVVDQERLRMDLYSAELLPFLTPLIGVPELLRFRLLRNRTPVTKVEWETQCKGNPPTVPCSWVCGMLAQDSPSTIQGYSERMTGICRRVRSNISSRVNGEHLYEFDGHGTPYIMAGPGSALDFRKNMLKRLAETIFNLGRIHNQQHGDFDVHEFMAYEELCDKLIPDYRSRPGHAGLCEYVFERLKEVQAELDRQRPPQT